MEPAPALWWEIARNVGATPPSDDFVNQLHRYRDWLATEAIEAGGIGEAERGRLDERHIADSLLFARVFGSPPEHVLDIGSGVGLPGIPLAILYPDTQFTLLDRSGRRVHLARRAIRVLGLTNVEVIQDDVERHRENYPVVVTRASLPPSALLPLLKSLVSPGGIGLVGGSWVTEPSVAGFQTQEIGSAILEHPVWILIMRRK